MTLSVTTGKQILPPRVFIYGTSGVGKTTLAASIPQAVFIPVEEGSDSLDCARLSQPTTFAQVLEHLRMLCTEEHDFSTLVIDSVTALEQLIWKHVVALENNSKIASLEDLGYGKGYVKASEHWRTLLEALTYLRGKRHMAIVLIGHVEVKTVNAPDLEPFDRYQPRLHKVAAAMLTEWSDVLLFANYKTYTVTDDTKGGQSRVRGAGNGERLIYTTERPSHLAKNRYSLPEQLPMQWAAIQNAIALAFAPAPLTTSPAVASATV